MLAAWLEPHAKMESYGNQSGVFNLMILLTHVHINLALLYLWIMHRPKYTNECTHAIKDLVSLSHLHVWTARVRLQQNNHLWLSAADKMHAEGVTCTTCRDAERSLGAKTHFLLVFFAFALFFLAWSARTVRRNQWAIILPLSGCRLLPSWHSRQKRMTLAEDGHHLPSSACSSETRSLGRSLTYIVWAIKV